MASIPKVLLSGASGLVGEACRLALQQRGYQVFALQRHKAKLMPGDVFWNPLVGELSSASLEGFTAIIHLGGENISQGRWSHRKKQRILESRVHSTELLSNTIAKLKQQPKLFLCASAVGYYGDTGDRQVTESENRGSGFLADVCTAWEGATLAAKEAGVRTVNLRIGVVLSPHGGALAKMLIPFALGLGGKIGGGQQYMSWVTLHDLTRIIAHLVENPTLHGAVNAVAPQPVTNAQFTQSLGKAMHRPTALPIPTPLARLALGEMADALLLKSSRVLPEKLLQDGFSFTHGDIFPALHDLLQGYQVGESRFAAHCWVPRTRAEVFKFFGEPKNLERLTPPWLNFQVIRQSTPMVGEGSEYAYQLKLHGVPLNWRSRIERWQPPELFADRQLKGPYALWYHTHRFFDHAGGTLVTDDVLYRVPYGLIGKLVQWLYVKRDLRRIFAYRHKVLGEFFS